MSRSLIGILTLCMGQAALANDCNQFHDPRYVYQAEIVRVYDGDTVFMDIDLGFRIVLHNEPLRLWGVDTPEVRGDEKERGIEVRDLVREWLPEGSETIIRTLQARDGSDRTGTFHRYLVVICPEGWSESVKTKQYTISMKLRKKVEMLFAHIKRILGLGRLRLRGPCGANDEFLLAATAQSRASPHQRMLRCNFNKADIEFLPNTTHLEASEMSRSALMTLGFTVGDVGAWLFTLWVCVDWYINLTLPMEDFMKATFKTGMDALAVLWA